MSKTRASRNSTEIRRDPGANPRKPNRLERLRRQQAPPLVPIKVKPAPKPDRDDIRREMEELLARQTQQIASGYADIGDKDPFKAEFEQLYLQPKQNDEPTKPNL